MDFQRITKEQEARIRECETPEDFLALAKAEGYELTDEELASIAAGSWSPKEVLPTCPNCNSYAISMFPAPGTGMTHCVCNDCGWQWNRSLFG